KLRGACVHHDNGVIGAATIARADERRVEMLKEAGFNALRSSHNPMSPAMLDACDRLGMLVMDEAYDTWTISKSSFDHAADFSQWWEREIEAMVRKDVNHPSVVIYSIGNEIPEVGSGLGSLWGRRLAEKIRSLDDTRFITNGVNGLVAVMDEVRAMAAERMEDSESMGVNALMANIGEMMNQLGSSELVTGRTAESFAVLDIAGMNYLDARYEMDRELFPHRIIVGSETFPPHIDVNWGLVKRNSHVIGDFTWTGWDYLGEVGVGRTIYADDPAGAGFMAPFPWLTAWVGDIDITGHRRPASYYREIVFGLRNEPYIAVQRPSGFGRQVVSGPWSWSDSVSSWTWNGSEGAPIRVEVYSDADEVELLLNGESIGRAPAGEQHRFRADFDTTYQTGELLAIAFTNGREQGRHRLVTATGPVRLAIEADRTEMRADSADLAFISIALTDAEGTLYTDSDRLVTVGITGPGALQGFGSARPETLERFTDTTHTTFGGRALAVIRPTRPGEVTVTVSAPGCESSAVTIRSVAGEEIRRRHDQPGR
ncbi:MAG: glycoside hydrolase family 2 protein, partial [Chloroflexia bacterium]|nr:glycoside hydrolase family 2 protein [Chloroflexia bacterium]